jgi:hypothetical protein
MNSSRQMQYNGNGKKEQVLLGVACSKTGVVWVIVLLIMLGKRLHLTCNARIEALK